MQERVQPTPPPTVKISQGEPPPDSWVAENIVQYLQDQSQASLLTDVMSYVKQLQAEQLTQARPRAMQMQESFASFPEQGSSEDMANCATYNAAQGYVKTQITYLDKMTTYLQQGNSGLASQLKPITEQLQQIAQSFPHLSPQQSQSLNTIMQQLTTLAQNTPQTTQRAFWNSQINMLQTMMLENQSNIADLQKQIQDLKAKIEQLTQLLQMLQSIKTTLNSTPPTPQQLQELTQNLQTLANQYGQLPPSVQQALGAIFQQLNQFKSASGQTLPQLLADTLVQSKLQAFLQANPKATPSQITAQLRAFLQQSNLQSSSLPLMQALGSNIDELISKKGFPATEGFSGEPFASQSGGNLDVNEQILSAILSAYSPDPNSSASLEKGLKSLSPIVTQQTNMANTQLSALKTTLGTLTQTQDNFGRGAAFAVGQSYAVAGRPLGATAGGGGGVGAADSQEPLPNQFAGTIINKYMPEQQAYLESLAMMLFLDNMGAGFGNSLMGILSKFANAVSGGDFNFSGSLTSAGGGNFNGSVSKAQQQLSNEKAACSQDINSTNSAINKINSQLAQILQQMGSKPPPTPSQQAVLQKMMTSLQNIQTNLGTCLNQLTALQKVLSGITIENPKGKGTSPSKQFSVSDSDPNWKAELNFTENGVNNGNGNKINPGGLNATLGLVTQFQQGYSDQSQNQQMVLQMQMTEIQQEWTVVSTSLQLLNQMYMTVCQAIYK